MKVNFVSRKLLVLGILTIGFIVSLFTAYLVYFSSERDTLIKRKVNQFLAKHETIRFSIRKGVKVIDAPFIFYTSFFPDKLEDYYLTIKQKDYRELQNNLNTFVNNHEVEAFKKEVEAEFEAGGQKRKISVRFLGDNPNHWQFDKKSWRIVFKQPFEGKEAINLIIPEDREYFLEIFSNHVAKKMGLLAPEMKFVNLFVNGRRQGVYLFAEQWSEAFLEQNTLIPESDLFGEDNLDGVSYLYQNPANFQKYTQDNQSKIDNFANLQIFLDYLNELEDQEFYQKIEEIIDLENFLTWEAHSTLLFSRAQRATHNAILLFNKEKGKFQFVPWNAFTGDYDIKSTAVDIDFHPLATRILKNPEWMYQRNQILWQYLSQEENEKEDFSFYDEWFNKTKRDFYKDRLKLFTDIEFLLRTKKHRLSLEAAYEKIKNELDKSRANVYLRQLTKFNDYSPKIATLDIESGEFSSVLLDNLEIESEATPSAEFRFLRDSNDNQKLDDQDVLVGKFEKKEDKIYQIQPEANLAVVHTDRELYKGTFYPKTKRQAFFISSSEPFFIVDLKSEISNAITGKKTKDVTTRFLDESVFRYLDNLSLTPDEFQKEYPIFRKEEENTFLLTAGTHLIKEPIIIPEGLKVKIKPGTILKFDKGVFLLSYGKIEAQGTESQPIIFTSSNSNEPWGVLGLVDKGASGSEFNHVILENASPVYVNGIFFSGGLGAHYADVKIEDSLFQNNHGDDAVNVKHAQVEIRNSKFISNDFDAIDLDATDGIVEGNLFMDNGNDAFDISFSKAHFRDNKVEKSGDKCVSIGEDSAPEIYQNQLDGCPIGVAVKDLSVAKIYNNKISNCQVAIGVYQKKEIFGGAKALIKDNDLVDNQRDFETDQGSSVEEF